MVIIWALKIGTKVCGNCSSLADGDFTSLNNVDIVGILMRIDVGFIVYDNKILIFICVCDLTCFSMLLPENYCDMIYN